MPKKKVTKKVAAKRNAKPAAQKVTRSRSSDKDKGSLLKWLILFVIVVLGAAFLYHHYVDERSAGEGSLKNGVMKMIQLDNDTKVNDDAVITATPTPSDNSTITPYVTTDPSTQSQY